AFARKPALTRQRTAMPDLMRNTADLVARTLHQEVVVDLPADERAHQSLVVEADANQLQQALVNLALNARDALLSRQGDEAVIFRLRSVALAVELAGFPQRVPPGDYVVVEVEDRGVGMAPEILNQALDPFF